MRVRSALPAFLTAAAFLLPVPYGVADPLCVGVDLQAPVQTAPVPLDCVAAPIATKCDVRFVRLLPFVDVTVTVCRPH